MTSPVLEWRCAIAAKQLMEATNALGISMPEGDDLSADQTRIWNIATAAGALITSDRQPGDNKEALLRMRGVVLGAIASADDLSPEDLRQFGTWLALKANEILVQLKTTK